MPYQNQRSATLTQGLSGNKLTRPRLRALIIAFFFIIAIPLVAISYNALKNIKDDALNQYKSATAGLHQEIESAVVEVFHLFGNAHYRRMMSLQSREMKFPGVLGYFQINHNNEFSFPLLADSKEDALSLGYSEADIAVRVKQIDKLLTLLHQNSLVKKVYSPQLINFQSQSTLLTRQSEKTNVSPNSATKSENNNSQQLMMNFKAPKPSKPTLAARQKDNNDISFGPFQVVDIASSSVPPLQSTLLPSGHFLLYRQVLRGGEQIMHGVLIEPSLFLKEVITKRFERSSIASFAQLAAYHQDTLLIDTPKNGLGYYDKVLGTYRVSSPLDKILLIFSYQDLPTQKGSRFITFLSAILLIVIALGLFAFYQLVLKQLQLMERQQGFVSAVSHELKTPLTSIKMYCEVLQQGWLDEDKQSQYYRYINEETDRLSRLIDNVLQAANISRNQLSIDLQPFLISDLPKFIHAKTEALFTRNDFGLNFHLDPKIENQHLNIDQDAFAQVMINLVDNAIKYSAKQEKRQVDITIEGGPYQEVAIKIRDYGIGIAPQETSKVFDLFYRVGNELTRTSKGTGLGLTLVKELVKHMGGEINVVNCEVGTEFIVYLPSQH